MPVLRSTLGWLISIALIAGIARTAPVGEIGLALRSVEPGPLIAAVFLVSLTLWLRGARWSVILASRRRVPTTQAAKVAIFGLALNAVLPGRAGEVARVVIASRRFQMGVAFTAATIVAERLLDGLVLLIFLSPVVPALRSEAASRSVEIFGAEVSTAMLGKSVYGLVAIVLILAAITLAVSFSQPRGAASWLVRVIPRALAGPIAPRLERLVDAVKDGMGSLSEGRRLGAVSLYSFAIWGAIALANLLVAWGVPGFELSIKEAIVLTAVSVAAASIPSAPGGWGVFEASGLLCLYTLKPDLDASAAVAYLVATHLCQYLPAVLLGFILWRLDERGRPHLLKDRRGEEHVQASRLKRRSGETD